jgi:hypothetical protein
MPAMLVIPADGSSGGWIGGFSDVPLGTVTKLTPK